MKGKGSGEEKFMITEEDDSNAKTESKPLDPDHLQTFPSLRKAIMPNVSLPNRI